METVLKLALYNHCMSDVTRKQSEPAHLCQGNVVR